MASSPKERTPPRGRRALGIFQHHRPNKKSVLRDSAGTDYEKNVGAAKTATIARGQNVADVNDPLEAAGVKARSACVGGREIYDSSHRTAKRA